jgi:serine/threonine protein kinase
MSTSETQQLRTADIDSSWAGDAAPESADDLLGATLNQTYLVERLLGEGGMGRVYLARHTRIEQKRVAVKVLHRKFAGISHVQVRFQREAEAAAAIAHPNVISVLDIDVTPHGMPYLVCEYLEGIDLSEHLRNVERLEVAAALSVTRQLCRGIGAAHARGVIHRDLKPPNVFLIGDFASSAPESPERLYVKVLDFGLSRFDATQDENRLTKTGLIMGTPSYMAPEQAQGKRVDHRADIYGVGAILYRTLTGRAPFQEDSPQATILAVMNSDPPRPRSLVATIPPHVELVIERAMAKDPNQRYPDMTAFEQALDAVVAMSAPVPSHGPPAPASAVPRARPRQYAPQLERDVHRARPLLLFYGLFAFVLSIGGATLAISGLELASGHTFERVELYLLLLAITGSALTPTVLWLLRIRQATWENSSRVLSLLGQLRAAVLGGAATYGLFSLAFNVLDSFLVRLLERPEVRPVGAHWTGWNLLLPSIALTAALALGWQRRRISSGPPSWGRTLASWCVTALALAVIAGLVYTGLLWRARLGGG